MTITVPLTPEEEATLIVLAEHRGLSPDALVRGVVKDIIDSVGTPPGISEETFHREDWYR